MQHNYIFLKLSNKQSILVKEMLTKGKHYLEEESKKASYKANHIQESLLTK